MIRAVIFDFDGTILDTELPDYEAWQAIFRAHQCELTLEAWSKCLGTTYDVFNPYDHLEELAGGPVARDRIEQEHRRHFLERVASQTVAAGVAERIAEARQLGLRLAVASSSHREWVVGHLTRLGLIGHFEAIRCRDDVARPKPAPDLYLAALEALGVAPHEAIAFEDSPNGAHAAVAAGIYCVAVPNAVSCRLPLDHAHRRVESLAGVRLADLIAECVRERTGKPD